MSNFDTFTANEAIAMIEDLVATASDGEDFQMNSAIVLLLARMEEAEAVTDEDSEHYDTCDVNHLPRRVLTAYKHCSGSFGNVFNWFLVSRNPYFKYKHAFLWYYKKFHCSAQKFQQSDKGVVENYIGIALTVLGMVLSDSWCQETYILSICNALIAYHKKFLDSCENPTVRKWAWSLWMLHSNLKFQTFLRYCRPIRGVGWRKTFVTKFFRDEPYFPLLMKLYRTTFNVELEGPHMDPWDTLSSF